MVECIATIERCKSAAERRPWGFNFAVFFARKWSPNLPLADGVALRPSNRVKQTGLEYVSSGGTTTGSEEPGWPRSLQSGRNTVQGAAISYSAQALSFDSLTERIESVVWSVDAALTFDESPVVDEPDEQSTGGHFSGGVAGEEYDAIATVTTTEGNIYEAKIIVSVV